MALARRWYLPGTAIAAGPISCDEAAMSNISASVFDQAVATTPSNTTDDPALPGGNSFAGLYCTATGTLKINDGRGQPVVFPAVAIGLIPVRCRRVWSTGTTATVMGLIAP